MSFYSGQLNQQNHLRQQQHQEVKTSQINSEEQTIKYTVRQDFLNLMSIAADFQAALECENKDKYFEDIKTMLHNKLILQVNLSSSIHYDQSYQHKNSPNLKSTLQNEKLKVKDFLSQIIQSKQFDPKIEKYLDTYFKKCLADHPVMLQEPLQQISQKTEFNQAVIQKLLNSITKTDQTYKDIQNGTFQAQELSESQIQQHIEDRKKAAKKKLQKEEQRDCNCQLI